MTAICVASPMPSQRMRQRREGERRRHAHEGKRALKKLVEQPPAIQQRGRAEGQRHAQTEARRNAVERRQNVLRKYAAFRHGKPGFQHAPRPGQQIRRYRAGHNLPDNKHYGGYKNGLYHAHARNSRTHAPDCPCRNNVFFVTNAAHKQTRRRRPAERPQRETQKGRKAGKACGGNNSPRAPLFSRRRLRRSAGRRRECKARCRIRGGVWKGGDCGSRGAWQALFGLRTQCRCVLSDPPAVADSCPTSVGQSC